MPVRYPSRYSRTQALQPPPTHSALQPPPTLPLKVLAAPASDTGAATTPSPPLPPHSSSSSWIRYSLSHLMHWNLLKYSVIDFWRISISIFSPYCSFFFLLSSSIFLLSLAKSRRMGEVGTHIGEQALGLEATVKPLILFMKVAILRVNPFFLQHHLSIYK